MKYLRRKIAIAKSRRQRNQKNPLFTKRDQFQNRQDSEAQQIKSPIQIIINIKKEEVRMRKIKVNYLKAICSFSSSKLASPYLTNEFIKNDIKRRRIFSLYKQN